MTVKVKYGVVQFSKDVLKLLASFKEHISRHNLKDLVEDYDRLARIVYNDYKSGSEEWKFAKVKPATDEKTKAILLRREIEGVLNRELLSVSTVICRRYFAKTNLTPVDVLYSSRAEEHFKAGLEKFIADTVKSEVIEQAAKLGGWKSLKFRQQLNKKFDILTDVAEKWSGLFFGNHWKGPKFFDLEGFVELPEELAEIKSPSLLGRLFK